MKLGDLWVHLGLKKDGFDGGLKDAQKSTQSFGSSVGRMLTGVAAKYLTVVAAVKALVDAAKTIATFERANSTLASVLGTTTKEIEAMSQSAKDLGRTTEFTAANVTELQIALARLGFGKDQILTMQGAVLKFASAVGTDLSSAADFTGSALRAFGLKAGDTTKLLDVMAASTTNSALDFSKLQTSISIVAPIAKSFGLTADQTASFLGVLANNGFDASSAATALRNVLLNLADSNGKLAKGIGHSAKNFDEIISAFEELNSRGIDVASVLAMTDKRAAGATTALIANARSIKDLNGKLTQCDGALNDMYDTMTDNVIGATRNLQSAWEGLMLAFESSKGPIKAVVQSLADALNELTAIIEGRYKDYKLDIAVDATIQYNEEKGTNSFDSYVSGINQAERKLQELKKNQASWFDPTGLSVNPYNKLVRKAERDLELLKRAKDKLYSETDTSIGPQPKAKPEPTKTTPPPHIITPEEEDQVKKDRERINSIRQNSMDENKALADRYEQDLALLRKYGEDTQSLQAKFAQDLSANLTDRADSNDLSEQVMTKEEVLKKHYDKILAIMEQYGIDSTALHDKYNVMLISARSEEEAAIKEEEDAMDELTTKLAEDILTANGLNFDPLGEQLRVLGEQTVAMADEVEQGLERAKEVFTDFRDTAIQGFVDGCQEMMDQLMGVGDVNAGEIFKAILDPLADLAIKEGQILVATGIGVEACKKALQSLNGIAAIAAGASLIAIGAAAKAGLKALASGGSSKASSAGSSADTSQNYAYEANTEITVYVEGRLKGSDIVLSGSKTQNSWGR